MHDSQANRTIKPALVWLGWDKNSAVLEQYLTDNGPRVLITVGAFVSSGLRQLVGRHQCELLVLAEDAEAPQRAIASRLRDEAFGPQRAQVWRAFEAVHAAKPNGERASAVITETVSETLLGFCVKVVDSLDTIASVHPVEMVVVNEDYMLLSKTVVNWAKARGIPSLHIEHNPLGVVAFGAHRQQNADRMVVSGQLAWDNYVAGGYDPQRLVQTGLPQFDRLFAEQQHRAEHRRLLCESLGVRDDRPIILFGTTWSAPHSATMRQDIYFWSVRAYFNAIKQLGGRFHCVIKDRPATGPESADALGEIAAQLGLAPQDWLYTNADPVSSLMAADMIVAVNSGLLVEAMMAGVPAINVMTDSGAQYGPGLPGHSGVVNVAPDALASNVARLIDDKAWRETQLGYMRQTAASLNAAMDGSAVSRIVQQMQSLKLAAPGQLTIPFDAREQQLLPWKKRYDLSPPASLAELAVLTEQWEKVKATAPVVIEFVAAPWRSRDAVAKAESASQLVSVHVDAAQRWSVATDAAPFSPPSLAAPSAEAWGVMPATVDAVLFGDVFATLQDPWSWLEVIRPLLKADAVICFNVGNARNILLLAELAEGRAPIDAPEQVQAARLYTRKELLRLLAQFDLRLDVVEEVIDPRLAEEAARADASAELQEVGFGRFSMAAVSPAERRELCATGFKVVATVGSNERELFNYRRETPPEEADAYESWLGKHKLPAAEAKLFEQHMASWPAHPKFHIFVYAAGDNDKLLIRTIGSLTTQLYYNSVITILADREAPMGLPLGERFRWQQYSGNPLAALNAVAATSDADWLCWLDAGDQLAEHSFLFIAEAAHRHPAWQVVYTDEDQLSVTGRYAHPQFKPDFNLDLLRAQPYTGALMLLTRAAWQTLGGVDAARGGVEEYDLMLRAYEQFGSAAIGHLHEVLYHRSEEGGHVHTTPTVLIAAAQDALLAHLNRQRIAADISGGYFAGSFRVDYQVVHAPLVSILLPVRDGFADTRRAIESIIEKTAYPRYELLILDNGSTDAATTQYLQGLDSLNSEQIRVYNGVEPQALPALYHALAQAATGEILVMLHPDIAVLDASWLSQLIGHTQRAEIGMVAPRLFDSAGNVRETARVLGLHGEADPAYQHIALDFAGYMGRAHLPQNVSAVSGGCVAIRKDLFFDFDGFNAANFSLNPEIELCLRLAAAGKQSLWTPFINLICDGEAAKRFAGVNPTEAAAMQRGEKDYLLANWLPTIARDPNYNRNLQLEGDAFVMHPAVGLIWDTLPWHPVSRIVALPADQMGCGNYRLIMPVRTAAEQGKIWGRTYNHHFSLTDLERCNLDTLVFQRQSTDEQILILEEYRKFARPLLVYEIDDLITHVPTKSVHKGDIPHDIAARFSKAVRLADRFMVSTEPLAHAYRHLCDDIRVVQNRLENATWAHLISLRNQGTKPRVGWAGGVGHTGDLELIVSVVKELAGEVEWVFFGMCPDAVRPFVAEVHTGVPFSQYPAKLASLNLDLALAPLEINPFNEAKSNLRLLEYGILGWPVICSDVLPYQGEFPVTRLKNRHADWIKAIRDHLSDKTELARRGDALKAYVQRHWMLDDYVDEWVAACTR